MAFQKDLGQTAATREGNQRVYEEDDIVRHYVKVGDKLKTGEEAILRRLAPKLRGGCLLDLGVGAGRTTPHLLALSKNYLGIDYSAEMIAACRAKFPGVDFREGDARHLEGLGLEKFDFVYFSFNGLDSIEHAGRWQTLREVYAVLKPGGWFLFSSHNLRLPPERPWQLGFYEWRWNPRNLLYNLRAALRGLRNYRRHAGAQMREEHHALLIDSGHDFQMLHYYIDPAEQVRQLEAAGFVEIEVFDRLGEARPLDAPELTATPHVHYLARKPERL